MKLTERINEIYERIGAEDNEFIKRFCRALDCIDTAVMELEFAFDDVDNGFKEGKDIRLNWALEWLVKAKELFAQLGIDIGSTPLYKNVLALYKYVKGLNEPVGTDVILTDHLRAVHESYVKFIMSVAILRHSTENR